MATQLGEYLLGERIAAGGMAEIYRAEIRGLGGFRREVAIKKILPEHCNDEKFVTMLLDEARIAARLQHPNIAQVIQCGCVDGAYFIVMELVDGAALSRVLSTLAKKEERLSVSTAVHVGVSLLRALDFAHKAKTDDGKPLSIVHRDVSPHNLLVSALGDVKLVDFGVAQAADRLHKTETGVLKGKLSYMAPEQVEGKGVDARSDQYAAALVISEALTSRRVHAGHSEIDVIKAVLDGRIDNIEEQLRDANVPNAAARPVLRALSRSASDRYEDCEAFAQALRAAVAVDVEAARAELGAVVARSRTEPARAPRDGDNDTEAPTKRFTPSRTAPTADPTVIVPPRTTVKRTRRFGATAGAAVALACGAAVLGALAMHASTDTTAPHVDAARTDAAAALGADATHAVDTAYAVDAHAAPGPGTSIDTAPTHAAVDAHAPPGPGTSIDTAPTHAAVDAHALPGPGTSIDTAPTHAAVDAHALPGPGTPIDVKRSAAKKGAVDVACLPWCEIAIDGKGALRSPLQGHPLTVGSHVVDVVNPPSGKHDHRVIDVRADETTKLGFRLE